jgi:hypothetical protein
MDWKTFVANVIGSVAWPLVIATAIYMLREETAALLRRIKAAKIAGTEIQFNEAPPAKIGERLAQEVKQIEAQAGEDGGEKAPPAPLGEKEGQAVSQTRHTLVARAFLAESLVLQELQTEFNAPARRNVGFGSRGGQFIADGVIEAPDGTYVIEVKLVKSDRNYKRRIIEAKHQIQRYRDQMMSWPRPVKFVIAIVVDGGTEELADQIGSEFGDSEWLIARVYLLDQLIIKYGLPPLS